MRKRTSARPPPMEMARAMLLPMHSTMTETMGPSISMVMAMEGRQPVRRCVNIYTSISATASPRELPTIVSARPSVMGLISTVFRM